MLACFPSIARSAEYLHKSINTSTQRQYFDAGEPVLKCNECCTLQLINLSHLSNWFSTLFLKVLGGKCIKKCCQFWVSWCAVCMQCPIRWLEEFEQFVRCSFLMCVYECLLRSFRTNMSVTTVTDSGWYQFWFVISMYGMTDEFWMTFCFGDYLLFVVVCLDSF